MPEQKTVRVRIAVAVDEAGNWSAYGRTEQSDAVSQMAASDAVRWGCSRGQSSRCVFVEADVPIPQPQTIEGNVVP